MQVRRQGFTLIELLVVIAILGILASILFPVFAKARESGRRAACASNVKQAQMAAMMYADAYDERLPFGALVDPGFPWTGGYHWPEGIRWKACLYPYFGDARVLACPNDARPGIGQYRGYFDNWGIVSSYGANAELMREVGQRWNRQPHNANTSVVRVTAPAETIVLYDKAVLRMGRNGRFTPHGEWAYPGTPVGWPPQPWVDHCTFPAVDLRMYAGSQTYGGAGNYDRHQGGCNLSFVDGHVKWLPAREFGYGRACFDKYWRAAR